MLINGGQLIADLDACTCSWASGFHAGRGKRTLMLDPPYTVVWNLELPFGLKVVPGVNHRGRGKQGQQDGDKSDLEIPVHAPYRLRCPQG
jgi:hypothetical protein